jgi:hypothetical protein
MLARAAIYGIVRHMNTMKSYKIPPRFYLDHIARGCGETGKIVRSTKNYLIVELDRQALEDLTSDALYYIECADTFDPPLTGLISSARATLKNIGE